MRLRQNNKSGPVLETATGAPTAEHRKAGRGGQMTVGGALVFLLISGIAALSGFGAVALTSVGICVALLVVGLMFYFESERQRQRPDPSRQSLAK